MITLLLSSSLQNDVIEVLGVLLSLAEALIVVFTLLSFFVTPTSKAGQILQKIIKGLYVFRNIGQSYVDHNDAEKEVEDNETNTRE